MNCEYMRGVADFSSIYNTRILVEKYLFNMVR